MPFLIALLGIAVAVYFFVIRARNAAHIADDLVDMANDARLAARRFGFRRRSNVHPVEDIDNPDLALAAAALAFHELDGPATQDTHDRLKLAYRKHLGLDEDGAEEARVLARWLIGQCGTPHAGFERTARKLQKLKGVEALEPLTNVIKMGLTGTDVSQRQREALEDLKRIFRV